MRNKKKIFGSLASATLVISLLTACSSMQGLSDGFSAGQDASRSEESANGASGSEQSDYKASMMQLAETETYLLDAYGAVTGDNYSDDLTLYNALVDLVPEVQTFIGEIEEINPTAANLRAVHELYLEAWNLQSKGMTLFIAALEAQDYEKVAEANEALAEGRALMRQFIADFDALG